MYRKYHTDGFVLDSLEFRDSDKVFIIFSRDLGLIRAFAKSVRESKSKLRYGLTDYSFSFFTVIKAKNGWKLTGAVSKSNLYFPLMKSPEKVLYLRIFTLLKKLLPTEEPQPQIFCAVKEAFDFLSENGLSDEQLKNLECITVLRILHRLGYLGSDSLWSSYVNSEDVDRYILKEFTDYQKKAVKAINFSLKESQLI